jgi:cyclophilin family peptidyl-prolyl cis-trans isomerase
VNQTFHLAVLLLLALPAYPGTLGTFVTSVGSMEIEFFDEDKPITVSNFIKYVTSGRFENQFLHRWEPGFVIQGGGYRVDTSNGLRIVPVQTFGTITNETKVGRLIPNTFGTISMARQDGQTNSATSQWFINLKDNAHLDTYQGGYTVFAHVTAGTNVLNLFIPPPPAMGIHQDTNIFPTLPVLATNVTYADLIYVDIKLRREVGLRLQAGPGDSREITWNSVAGVVNRIEYTTQLGSTNWNVLTNVSGTGAQMQVTDSAADTQRTYRTVLIY